MNPTVNSRFSVLIKVVTTSTKLLLPPTWNQKASATRTLQLIHLHSIAQQNESIAPSLTWYAPCSTNPNYLIPSGSKLSTLLSKSKSVSYKLSPWKYLSTQSMVQQQTNH